MNMDFEPLVREYEIDGRTYTFELCRQAVLEADRMGIMGVNSNIQILEIVFYAALKKHKPDITPSLAKRILNAALGEDGDGDYDIADFNEWSDEFMRWYKVIFTSKGKKKRQPQS